MTKKLCQYRGGSHLYGISTPESDVDERGVFLNTDPAFILGTKRFDQEVSVTVEHDKNLLELRHFFTLLKKGNSQALECLFAPDYAFEFISPEFEEIRKHNAKFVDVDALKNCLAGYAQGEYKLALGERKGKLGGKRHAAVERLGFSYKNFVQLFRLLYMGIRLFESGKFVIDLKNQAEPEVYDFLWKLKTSPESFDKEELVKLYESYEKTFFEAYDAMPKLTSDKWGFTYDEAFVNDLLRTTYLPYLVK